MRRMILTFMMIWLFPILAFAGWEHNEIGTWYKNEEGTYKTGWHQDYDGQWYYLDDNTGYMLSETTTPDGYYVNNTGAWVAEGGDNQNVGEYDNKADFEINAYSFGPSTYKEFEYTLPVTVHYNNNYASGGGRKITINEIGMSKEGALYVKYSMSEATYLYSLDVVIRYISEDGTYIDVENKIDSFCGREETTATTSLMEYPKAAQELQPVRADVFINECSAQ